jgi:CBS domain-containing protein
MNVGQLCGDTFVIGATTETSVHQAAKKMHDEQVGALVVVGGDGRVVGVVTDRDLVVRVLAVGKNPDHVKLGEVMSKPAKTVSRATDVFAAAKLMREARVRRLPVVDDHGRATGMITLDDLITAASDAYRDLAAVPADARAAARMA